MERIPVLGLKVIGIESYCFLIYVLMWLIGFSYFIPTSECKCLASWTFRGKHAIYYNGILK